MTHRLTLVALVALIAFSGAAYAQEKTPDALEEFILAKSVTPQGETPEDKKVRMRAIELAVKERLELLAKEARKSESRLDKKAREQVEKEDKNTAKHEHEERKAISHANVVGCPADSVWVSSNAENYDVFNVGVELTVVNTTPLYKDIRTSFHGFGTVVRGLCPGGSITLSFRRQMAKDSSSVQIPLAAVSEPNPAQGVIVEERNFYLNVSDVQYNRVRSETWELYRRQ